MFDYIVIGAGSAGCVLASRLTERPDTSVLLIEAGPPDRKREIHIPAAFSKLFRTDVDWNFSTDPQAHLNGRSLYWPRGKTLGGSSSINAMIYIRGARADFDAWRDMGNAGWGFDDVLPMFKAVEHATGGPLHVEALRSVNPLTRAFLDACDAEGIANNPDFNGAMQMGAGLYQVTQKNGARDSAADAYLKPALRRGNLTVWTNVQVARVLMEEGRATGVEFFQKQAQERQQVRAGSGSDPMRGRRRVATTAAAVRDRAAEGTGSAADSGDRGSGGRRRELAGSFERRPVVSLHAAGFVEQCRELFRMC